MKLTDTHAHLYWDRFDEDRDAVIARCAEFNVTRVLIPGTTVKTSLASVKLAESHPHLFAAVGIHPTNALTWTDETKDELRKMVKSLSPSLFSPRGGEMSEGQREVKKIVAIGEIGLDYYWNRAPHDIQKRVLREQLSLAEELKLPVVLHLREKGDATEGNCTVDLLEILEKWLASLRSNKNPLVKYPGVLHSFSGTLKIAEEAIRLGFMIGVTGPITYKKMSQRREMIASLPLEKILIETDSPFLTPHPKRGKRNEPANIRFIAEKIADIHGKETREIATITTANAARLFNW
ncbi:MAG: TatD family hydrolase [Anaerolineae bacterium]|nr:TatD family hydrolase [Anaerolineae bacterium]MBT7188883.1 TatD family hydrolase [Anaerolineae bacterium]MBT7783020.1 TatD family hydrolase [Anaerolineae bacterium]